MQELITKKCSDKTRLLFGKGNMIMRNYYFAFGSDLDFPYQNTYLIVKADSKRKAIEKFRKEYPDRHKNTFNCAFMYDENEWDRSDNQKYYPKNPAEIIE